MGRERGHRIREAFMVFEKSTASQSRTIGLAARQLGVSYATSRVWWFQWRIAQLEEACEFATEFLDKEAPRAARRELRAALLGVPRNSVTLPTEREAS